MVALLGATLITGITLCSGTTSLTPSGLLFAALVVALACLPYLGSALLCHVIGGESWKRLLLFGLIGYLGLDAYVRVRSLYYPQTSTDALIVLVLPEWSPVVIGIVGALVLALMSFVRRAKK